MPVTLSTFFLFNYQGISFRIPPPITSRLIFAELNMDVVTNTIVDAASYSILPGERFFALIEDGNAGFSDAGGIALVDDPVVQNAKVVSVVAGSDFANRWTGQTARVAVWLDEPERGPPPQLA